MLFIYFTSIAVTTISCLIVAILFKKAGVVDTPDGIRKIHKGDIALGGGLVLFLSSVLCFLFFPDYKLGIDNKFSELSVVYLTSIIILILGLWDDIKPLPTAIRLIVQIFASWLVIILTDFYISDLGNLFGLGDFYLGELGIPITIFMVVGVCNAFNMMDGMDGLVSFVVLVASTSLAFIAFLNSHSGVLFLGTAILSVFLLFNLGLFGKRWKIFLGDSGSMWLGYVTGWFLVILSQGDEKIFQPVTALWLIFLPLIDALSTFLSRIWNRKSLFLGDRSHIHHILLDSGIVKWKVLVIFLIISIITSSFGVFANFYSVAEHYQFYGFLTLWFFYFLLLKFPLTKNIDHL